VKYTSVNQKRNRESRIFET